jgi:hypothetical protein
MSVGPESLAKLSYRSSKLDSRLIWWLRASHLEHESRRSQTAHLARQSLVANFQYPCADDGSTAASTA